MNTESISHGLNVTDSLKQLEKNQQASSLADSDVHVSQRKSSETSNKDANEKLSPKNKKSTLTQMEDVSKKLTENLANARKFPFKFQIG